MAAWRKKFSVVPDEDMCFSCFATTKYSCIKCGHSVCNRCSVFQEDEETPGWVAGKSVGYCIPCEKEEGASKTVSTKNLSVNGQEERVNSGQGMKRKSELGETTSSGQGEKMNNNEEDKREAMSWLVVFLTVYVDLLN